MHSKFLLTGDCNVDISRLTTLCHQLLDIANQHGLPGIRTGHTRMTDSIMTTIDLAFTTSTSNKSCETIPPLGTSDHYGLLSLYLNSLVPRKIWRYKHADFKLANDLLSQDKPSTVIVDDNHDVNESWKKWNNEFLRITEQCIPHGTLLKRKNLPWLSKSIIQLMRK